MNSNDSILAYLKANPKGVTRAEMSETLGISIQQVGVWIGRLMADGTIVGVTEGGIGKDTRSKRYYLAENKPPETVKRHKQRTAAPSRGWEGEARITADTKVTICPPFVDRRFEFNPPPGWKGQITLDREQELGQ